MLGNHRTAVACQIDVIRHGDDVRVTPRVGPYWRLQLAGWATYAVIAAVTLMPMFPPDVIPRLLLTKAVRGALGLPFSDMMRRLYSLLQRRSAPAWVWVGVAAPAHLMIGVAWYLAFVAVTSLWRPPGIRRPSWAEVPHQSLDCILVLTTWSALYFGILHWRQAQGDRARAADAAREAERAQLAALRYQLNPHFLFNALNSIRSSITDDPSLARGALTRLSDLLRQTAYAPRSEWTPLQLEMEWVRNYLALEQLRFGDRLETCLAIEDSAGTCLVPSFLMHPLVENAVKHGRRTGPTPLRIRINAKRQDGMVYVDVSNTGRLSVDSAGSAGAPDTDGLGIIARGLHGLGVTNIRERLALLDPVRNRLALVQDHEWVRVSVHIAQPSGPR
jgi:two-component system LytT family sensor kinase